MTETVPVTVPDSVESLPGGHQLQLRTVPITAVVPHPANPRTDLGNLTELRESIAEQGVLQPPVVLPADRVAAAWPDHAEALAAAELVVLMGHRRRAAAAEAADDPAATMPVLVRTDAVCDDALAQLDAMTAENVARKALTAMEEARAFDAARQAGRSQRQIAAVAGCSQGHVSKRLSLLRLPAQMLKALEAGELDVGDAVAYAAGAGGDEFIALAAYKLRREQNWRDVDNAIAEVKREQQHRRQVEAAREKLAAEKVPVIDDLYERFGNDAWRHRLDGKKAIATARKASTLAATIDRHGGVTYYSTAKPKRSENRTPYEEEQLREQRERSRAMKGREAACAQIAAADLPSPAGLVTLLAEALLHASDADMRKLAHRWLAAAGDPVAASAKDHYDWRSAVLAGDARDLARAGHAVVLAGEELKARWVHSRWEPRTVAYLARLGAETGYEPTEWEQARLTAARAGGRTRPAPDSVQLGYDDTEGWVLDVAGVESSHDRIPYDEADTAQTWAVRLLADLRGRGAGHRGADRLPVRAAGRVRPR